MWSFYFFIRFLYSVKFLHCSRHFLSPNRGNFLRVLTYVFSLHTSVVCHLACGALFVKVLLQIPRRDCRHLGFFEGGAVTMTTVLCAWRQLHMCQYIILSICCLPCSADINTLTFELNSKHVHLKSSFTIKVNVNAINLFHPPMKHQQF